MQLAYSYSGIMITFKLRCITETTKIHDNMNSKDLLRLNRIVYNRKLDRDTDQATKEWAVHADSMKYQ